MSEMNEVTVVPARYEGWTISGKVEAGAFAAHPVRFGSSDPTRPLAGVYVNGWQSEIVHLDADDIVGSVRAEGARQWRSILNG